MSSNHWLSFRSFRPLRPDQSSFLDSLRGASSIAVLIGHENQLIVGPSTPVAYAYTGLLAQFSVMVFFVLSGFLIGKSITRQCAHGDFDIGKYAVDRAARIMPPLVFSLLLVIALASVAPSVFPSGSGSFLPAEGHLLTRREFVFRWPELLSSLLLVNGFRMPGLAVNAVLWSLPFEAWLYAILGVVALAHTSQSRLMWSIAASAFCALSWLNPSFAFYSIVWLSGFLLCLLHNSNRLTCGLRIRKFSAVMLAAVAVLIAALYVVDFGRFGFGHFDAQWIVAYNVASGLAFACFISLVIEKPHRKLRWLAGSSGYSYTLYIVHFPILLFIFGAFQEEIQNSVVVALMFAFATAVAVMACSRLVARFLENRIAIKAALGLRRRLE